MVKSLSRDLPRLLTVIRKFIYDGLFPFSRNYFPGKHLKDFQSERDFRLQKKKIMNRMVQVEFVQLQNQANKRVNPN